MQLVTWNFIIRYLKGYQVVILQWLSLINAHLNQTNYNCKIVFWCCYLCFNKTWFFTFNLKPMLLLRFSFSSDICRYVSDHILQLYAQLAAFIYNVADLHMSSMRSFQFTRYVTSPTGERVWHGMLCHGKARHSTAQHSAAQHSAVE